MRKILALLTAVVLVALGTKAFAATFPDTSNTVYSEAFAYLSERGVVQGYSDGLARPDGYLNRAEALKVLVSARGHLQDRAQWFQEGHMPAVSLFLDIDQAEWYASYVETAFEKGIVTGYPDGTFRPGQWLRTEEAIAMLLRTYGETGEGSQAQTSAYLKNTSGQWFTPYFNTMISRNLVMHAGQLKPGQPITRGQFFDMVYRRQLVNEQNQYAYSGSEPRAAIASVPQPSAPATISAGNSGGAQISMGGNEGGSLSISAPQPAGAVTASANTGEFSISIPGLSTLTITHPADATDPQSQLDVLNYGVGHLFGYPGGGSKILIYGHSSNFPWLQNQYSEIFRRINELNTGDRFTITYNGQVFTYEVTGEEAVLATDTTRYEEDGSGEEVILYTCWPPDDITHRYLVYARPVNSVAQR